MAIVILSTEELINTVIHTGMCDPDWFEYLCVKDIVALGIACYLEEFTSCSDDGQVQQIAIRLLNDHLVRDPIHEELVCVLAVWARVAELVEAKVPLGSFSDVRYAGCTTNGHIINLIKGRADLP